MKLLSLLPLLTLTVSAGIFRRTPQSDLQQVDQGTNTYKNAFTNWAGTTATFGPVYNAHQQVISYLTTAYNNLANGPTLTNNQCTPLLTYFVQPTYPDLKALLQTYINRQPDVAANGSSFYNAVKNYLLALRQRWFQYCGILPSKCPSYTQRWQVICSSITADFAAATNAYP